MESSDGVLLSSDLDGLGLSGGITHIFDRYFREKVHSKNCHVVIYCPGKMWVESRARAAAEGWHGAYKIHNVRTDKKQ